MTTFTSPSFVANLNGTLAFPFYLGVCLDGRSQEARNVLDSRLPCLRGAWSWCERVGREAAITIASAEFPLPFLGLVLLAPSGVERDDPCAGLGHSILLGSGDL